MSSENMEKQNNKEYTDTEYEILSKIINRIIEEYNKAGNKEKADRLRYLLDYVKDKDNRVKLVDIVNKMLDDISMLLNKGDYAGALKYFIECLDEPDTILAYVYMWKPDRAELMLSITIKSIILLSNISKRYMGGK